MAEPLASSGDDREWLSFEDEGEHRTWLFDITFLTSNWTCIYGAGCPGVLAEPAPDRQLGCCTHGAYIYADIIQGAGAVPIDVRAMGIDFAACSTFKWLMGVKGFGFLYVREDLQGTVAKPTQYCGGVSFEYPPWRQAAHSDGDIAYAPVSGPGMYEVSCPSYEGAVSAQVSLRYILDLGIDHIRAHARELTDRLQRDGRRPVSEHARRVMQFRRLAERTERGVMGDPTVATAEKGERMMQAMVDSLVEVVADIQSGRLDA